MIFLLLTQLFKNKIESNQIKLYTSDLKKYKIDQPIRLNLFI